MTYQTTPPTETSVSQQAVCTLIAMAATLKTEVMTPTMSAPELETNPQVLEEDIPTVKAIILAIQAMTDGTTALKEAPEVEVEGRGALGITWNSTLVDDQPYR